MAATIPGPAPAVQAREAPGGRWPAPARTPQGAAAADPDELRGRPRQQRERRQHEQADWRRRQPIVHVVGVAVDERRRHEHPAIELVDVTAERVLQLQRDAVLLLDGDAEGDARGDDEQARGECGHRLI